MSDDSAPCGVELSGRGRGAAAGHPVWLLDQRDGVAQFGCRIGGRKEVRGMQASARSVSESQRPRAAVAGPKLDAGRADRRLDCPRGRYTPASSRSARSQLARRSELPSSRWMKYARSAIAP